MSVTKETIIGKEGYIDELLKYVDTEAILKKEEYDKEAILRFLEKIEKELGNTWIIAKVAKRMEQLGYTPSYIAGVIDILAEVREKKISREERRLIETIESISKSIAKEVSKVDIKVTQPIWSFVVRVDLSTARTVPELIGDYPEGADCIVYLPDSDGTGTIYLDNPTAHGYAMGTFYGVIRAPFRSLYISNSAQSGKYMYLSIGKGDIAIERPTKIQAQLRSVVASTSTALKANASYTSSWFDALDYGHISYLTNSDVAAATDGVILQESNDGVTPHYQQTQSTTLITIGGVNSYYARLDSIPRSRYVRVIYTNGGSDQTSFSLLCLARAM